MTQTHDGPARHDVPPGPLGALAGAAWQALLVAGLVSVVLGILVLVWPDASLRVAGVLFGLYLLFSGVMQLVAAFGTHATTALRVMAFISGALSILLGLFCFRGAMQSTLLLALWIGISWLFRGITQTVAAASDPAMPARGWQIFLGVVSAVMRRGAHRVAAGVGEGPHRARRYLADRGRRGRTRHGLRDPLARQGPAGGGLTRRPTAPRLPSPQPAVTARRPPVFRVGGGRG